MEGSVHKFSRIELVQLDEALGHRRVPAALALVVDVALERLGLIQAVGEARRDALAVRRADEPQRGLAARVLARAQLDVELGVEALVAPRRFLGEAQLREWEKTGKVNFRPRGPKGAMLALRSDLDAALADLFTSDLAEDLGFA